MLQCFDGVDAKIAWHFCYGNAWGNRLSGIFPVLLSSVRTIKEMPAPVEPLAEADAPLRSIRELPTATVSPDARAPGDGGVATPAG